MYSKAEDACAGRSLAARLTAGVRHPVVAAYCVAAAMGLAAVFIALPFDSIQGTGGLFRFPQGDLPVNLVGHLAFQSPHWHWPPLLAPDLAWPAGESIAMTDSNPALTVLAKIVAMFAGHRLNLMGLWFALCLLAQPIAAVYALNGFLGRSQPGLLNFQACAAAAASASLLLPEFLFRTIHINLFGQFLLIIVIGMSVRLCLRARPVPFWPGFLLLLLIVFIHPYLFVFSAITLAAPAMQLLVGRRPGARDAFRMWGLSVLLAAFAFVALSESTALGGPGFGLYSMNLLGPFVPQLSGLFGPRLPILDATGFQQEGFNYLGAGNLLLLAAGLIGLIVIGGAARRAMAARLAGFGICMICLTLLAVTPRLTWGGLVVLPLDIPVLDKVFAAIRASGRAIWVVDYAVILATIGFLGNRLRARILLPLLVAVILLQWFDTAPLRAAAGMYFAGEGETAPPFSIPFGTSLFSVIPWCSDEQFTADGYRLFAFRAGARLKEVRAAHPPTAERCAASLENGLQSAMAPGESRLFLNSAHLDARADRLGTGVSCASSAAGLLCHRPP